MSNDLIYAMSTSGSMSTDRFSELFRYVYYPYASQDEDRIDINARQQTIRILDSLGYCEFDFDKRIVYMCRPSLVLIPSFGLPTALLTGARGPKFLKNLKAAVNGRWKKAKIEYKQHSENNAAIPATICIQAIDKDVIREIADQVGISCDLTSPAAWRIADMSETIDGIKSSLHFSSRAEPEWSKRIFDTERLVFSGYLNSESNNSLVEYLHPVTRQYYHWIWNEGKATDTDRDWGRYIALEYFKRNILFFDEKQLKLAVPVTVPLPCLLSRAAALCSGIPPSTIASCNVRADGVPANHPIQVYSSVTREIAELIAGKLNQKLLYTDIKKDSIEVPHA